MRVSTIASLAALPALALAAPYKRANNYGASVSNDILVAQFAATLEALEYSFYDAALTKFNLSDIEALGLSNSTATKIATTLGMIRSDEKAHLDALDGIITGAGYDLFWNTCTLDFTPLLDGGLAAVIAAARTFEVIGVGAYAGAAPLLSDNYLITAAEILTIEARHSTFLNMLNGGEPIPAAFDIALSPAAVISLVVGSGVITGGCDLKNDLGLTGYPSLTAAPASGTTFTPGTAVNFTLAGAPQVEGFCQIVGSGSVNATVQGAGQCAIPADAPAGPYYIYLTGSETPISANPNLNAAASSSIFAGPSLVFVETPNNTVSWFS